MFYPCLGVHRSFRVKLQDIGGKKTFWRVTRRRETDVSLIKMAAVLFLRHKDRPGDYFPADELPSKVTATGLEFHPHECLFTHGAMQYTRVFMHNCIILYNVVFFTESS